MDALPSLQSLGSVAIWPVLAMNWQSILAYFPAVERFINGLNVDILIEMILGTWIGWSGLALLSALTLSHFAYSTWKTLRNLALVTFYTKCSIEESSSMHDQVLDWITRDSRFHTVSTNKLVLRYDNEIEVPDTEENIDVSRMINEVVSRGSLLASAPPQDNDHSRFV